MERKTVIDRKLLVRAADCERCVTVLLSDINDQLSGGELVDPEGENTIDLDALRAHMKRRPVIVPINRCIEQDKNYPLETGKAELQRTPRGLKPITFSSLNNLAGGVVKSWVVYFRALLREERWRDYELDEFTYRTVNLWFSVGSLYGQIALREAGCGRFESRMEKTIGRIGGLLQAFSDSLDPVFVLAQ